MSVITLEAQREAPVLAGSAAIDEFNIAIGEVANTLPPDDPRRGGLLAVQAGLDQLYAIECERKRTCEYERSPEFRTRLGAALERIGHQGSPAFRDRIADAFVEVSR